MTDLHTGVELQVNVCGNVYGVLPCTAALGPGFECTNSFATCQDRPNYLQTWQTIGLRTDNMLATLGDGFIRDSYPLLTADPKFTSTEIKRGEGVAVRGGVDIICTDAAIPETYGNGIMDPYASTRENPGAGTFWGKFKARFPYYSRSKVIINVYDLDTGAVVDSWEYRLETIQGPDPSGKVILKCRDLLTNIDRDQSQFPQVDSAKLDASINPSVTTITVNGQNNAIWPATDGAFVIEDEFITYANHAGGVFTGCTRGAGGTANVSHDFGESVILAVYWNNVNVVDVIYDILTTYCDIDPAYIPYNDNPADPDEWDDEKAAFLSGYNITRVLYEPIGAVAALTALCSQSYINLWYDPKRAKIRISATNTALASQQADPITDRANILTPGVKITEREKRQITQSWFYYDKRTLTAGNEPADYSEVDVSVNTVLESPNAWGVSRKIIRFGSWLYGADNIAIVTNSRLVAERSRPQYEVTFLVDYKDSALGVGQFINLRTDEIQDQNGEPLELTWQIIKLTDKIPGATIEVVAASIRDASEAADIRLAYIVNVANESVEYGDSALGDRDLYAWIAAVDGFANGDTPYNIQ